MKNLKELDVRVIAHCAKCGWRFGEVALTFSPVAVASYVLNLPAAVRRQMGLTMMMGGNAAIAGAMGLDEDMVFAVSENMYTLCTECRKIEARNK